MPSPIFARDELYIVPKNRRLHGKIAPKKVVKNSAKVAKKDKICKLATFIHCDLAGLVEGHQIKFTKPNKTVVVASQVKSHRDWQFYLFLMHQGNKDGLKMGVGLNRI